MKKEASYLASHPLLHSPCLHSGLVKLGASVGISLLPPRKKITILLIGNHSAGKSSFINWYIEEHVQKTAVAIETQGFALVTSGKRRESLTVSYILLIEFPPIPPPPPPPPPPSL